MISPVSARPKRVRDAGGGESRFAGGLGGVSSGVADGGDLAVNLVY
jgi:hypothetical protein